MRAILLGVLGGQEILLIAVIILIFFGGKKIPELMRGLGKGMREYNKAVNDVKDQINNLQEDIKSSTTADTQSKQYKEEKTKTNQ